MRIVQTLAFIAGIGAGTAAWGLDEITDFAHNPGALRAFLHRPEGAGSNLPLIVALHGCTQEADDFDNETGLTALADDLPALLLLPEQNPSNMARRCFRWWDTDDNRPASGESASILAMIDHAIAVEGADPDRVFILGLSAGGSMAGVMMANHPARFQGGAVIAGLPFDCNRPRGLFDGLWWWLHTWGLDGADASYACGLLGAKPADREATDWAEYARSVAAGPQIWPPVSLWQGGADGTVNPDNLRELVDQWTGLHQINARPDSTETVGTATRQRFFDAQGKPRVEAWALPGFPHAVPIDGDGDPLPCGTTGAHIAEANLCAVREIARFWGLHQQ